MEENRFFKFVWRFNGVILMVAGILSVCLLVYGGLRIYSETKGRGSSVSVSDEKQDAAENWTVSSPKNIGNGPYAMVSLSDEYSTRSILFINTNENKQKWLFDSNDFLIDNTIILPENDEIPTEKEKEPARAILYLVIKKDSNNDKQVDSDDKAVIALSEPSGENYKELFNDCDAFLGQQTADKDTLIILFQKGDAGYIAKVSLKDFSVQNLSKLPKIKNAPDIKLKLHREEESCAG